MKSITAKRARRAGRGWTGARGDRPDVVRCSPQTLIPSSPSTTSSGDKAPATGRTWCAAPCKPLFLRRRAPRLPGPWRRWRAGRGAPRPANPYSFVTGHHVFRGQGAGNGPDVVRRSPQTLIPSSPSTTSSGAMAPAAGRTWCAAHRKPLFLRHRAPRLPGPWRRCWRDPTKVKGFARSQAPTWPSSRRENGAGVGVTRRKTIALRGAKRQLGRPRAGRFRFFISNSMTFLRIRKN